jgi:hypothetical protein
MLADAAAEIIPTVRLMVVEQGAIVPDPPACDSCSELVVVVQDRDADPVQVTRRTVQKLASIERAGQRIVAMLIAVAARTPRAGCTRNLLARALASHLGRAGEGELTIVAPPGAAPTLRHELLALAGTLTAELGSSRVSISVRFPEAAGERELKSGLRATQAALSACSTA